VFARDRKTGVLTQLLGTDACVSQDGSGGDCADGVGLDAPFGVAVSPDGRNVYVGSQLFVIEGSSPVAVFARDRKTGALTQLPATDACISEDGSRGDCADGVGLLGARSVAVSPDGRTVYVAATDSSAVAAFAHDRKRASLATAHLTMAPQQRRMPTEPQTRL
jgi:DNA-binding beta-propeller fold protein YncE